MLKIDATDLDFRQLNDKIRMSREQTIEIDNCLGQRYIGDASSKKSFRINGTPGNALGAYLDGSEIEVFGNAQDAIGDTMNDGKIIVHGNVGDTCGYAMRGGEIYIENNVGYRAGIHMKEFKDKKPVIIIGNKAGSFLGEYQAGGLIIVLGLKKEHAFPVGRFCGTGMHGGKMFLRCSSLPLDLPDQVKAKKAKKSELNEIIPYIDKYCELFKADKKKILDETFFVITPDSKNPYKRLYTPN